MLVVESFELAIGLLLGGLLCWGSWGVMLNSTRLEHSVTTVYFVSAQAVVSCVACFTFGMVETEASPEVFTEVLPRVDALGACAALLGGALVAYANALLTQAIALCGVAVAMPAVIGTGLVGGSILNYIFDPKGDPVALFSGIALCLLALLFNMMGYLVKQSEQRPAALQEVPAAGEEAAAKDTTSTGAAAEAPAAARAPSPAALLAICGGGGLLSALWSPMGVWAQTGRGLGAYQVLFFFNFGQPLVIPLLLLMSRNQQLDWGDWRKRAICIAAGAVNVSGLIIMFIAGSAVSFAMAFGILQCSPLVASLWGLLFGELRGASRRQVAFFCAMLASYSGAIVAIALSQASL